MSGAKKPLKKLILNLAAVTDHSYFQKPAVKVREALGMQAPHWEAGSWAHLNTPPKKLVPRRAHICLLPGLFGAQEHHPWVSRSRRLVGLPGPHGS